ncbi:MAG: tetratricopeptide (TPR) repeat protein, partial [Saprospiraceae bacterium]
MKRNLLLLAVIGLLSNVHAQNFTKEKMADNTTVTVTEGGMYDGTNSKEAGEYYDKAAAYSRNKEFKKAKKYYLKALKKDDTFVEAYDNVGQICRRLGEHEDAIKYYKKSIAIYPKGAMAHQNLAIVYGIQKEYKKSILEYGEIVKIDTENPEGYFGIAKTYLTMGQYKEGIIHGHKTVALYEKLDSHHKGDGYYLLGLLYYYDKNNEKAKEFFTLAKNSGVKLPQVIKDELFKDKKDNIILKVKEDYAVNENNFIKSYNWLMTTPVGGDPEQRKAHARFLMRWMTGSPTVAIELSDKVVTYMDCGNCLMIFMGGWSKNAIESKADDKFKGA